MNRKARALGLLVVVAAAASLVAGCSGDDGDKSTGAGGSNTSAGTGGSKAGSSSSGSSSGGNDSGGKSTSGGNNNAGTNNTGGFNFGGAGIDELMCDPLPQNGSACEMGDGCFEGSTVCACVEEAWSCFDIGAGEGGGPGGGFGELECPMEQPMTGGDCTGIGFCPYGQNMGCACDGSMWACSE